GQKAQGQTPQNANVGRDELPRLWRIAIELLRFEVRRKHRIYKSSRIGLPCASGAEKPSMEPSVGTRSIDSIGRSNTTPSRTPAPKAIIQVVRESASPVRWCWKPLPPASSSESRPKSGKMNRQVLPAYSGSLWMVFQTSAQRRSVRRIPSIYRDSDAAWEMSILCMEIHS